MAGVLLGALNLITIAILIYAVAVAFHLVTLPVEFNASRRAGQQLRTLGLVTRRTSRPASRRCSPQPP